MSGVVLVTGAASGLGRVYCRELAAAETGVKFDAGNVGITVNAFYNLLMNITGQGAEVCPGGGTCWVIRESPDNRSYGTEIEAVVSPIDGMQLQGSATFLEAELGGGVDSLADLEGERLGGVPQALGNLALFYSYFNFGIGLAMPASGVRLNLDLLNAFQSKGLEEGNPRLVSQGGTPIFLARPLLPRRLQASIEYDFGGSTPLGR